MKPRSTSRRLAVLAMLALAAVSVSALAAWIIPPPALIPINAELDPTPLLLLGLALIALGLGLRDGTIGNPSTRQADDLVARPATGGD